jgi:hypothetical protein
MSMRVDNRFSIPVLLSLVAAVLVGPLSSLNAQSQSSILSHEAYCEKLQTALDARGSSLEYLSAISNIQSCRSVAAKALIAQWNRTQTDPATLEVLGRITPLIRDQQLFEAAASVAADDRRSRNERLSAFSALAGYFDSTVSISYTDRLEQPGLTGFSYVFLGFTSSRLTSGTSPLHSDTRSRVLQIFTRTASSEPDSTIRSIALFLSEVLPRIH